MQSNRYGEKPSEFMGSVLFTMVFNKLYTMFTRQFHRSHSPVESPIELQMTEDTVNLMNCNVTA